METLLLRKSVRSSPSLQCFQDFRDNEKRLYAARPSGVDNSGELLEYHTLVQRLEPCQVLVDNEGDSQHTLITIDSANRPGTLVEVVQHFTELSLEVKRARISSDGGWFMDVFEVVENSGEKVLNRQKLCSIKQMLSVHYRAEEDAVANGDETDDLHRVETTVFELAGEDKAGLLAEITQLLLEEGCDVRSAAVWTYKGRVAFVLSVTEKGKPVTDAAKVRRLEARLMEEMDKDAKGIVHIKPVRGEVHHDRRLHQLMLQEDCKEWARHVAGLPADGVAPPPSVTSEESEPEDILIQPASSPTDSVSSLHAECSSDLSKEPPIYRSPKYSAPEIMISKCRDRKYWMVSIKCKDRNKLLFDTVCTLADLEYDVFHASIDSAEGVALQEYYIKSRTGGTDWDEAKAGKLKAMLAASIQRRFPKGLKVHVQSVDRFGCLSRLTTELQAAGLSITRAKVKTYAVNNSSGHTFYVMDASGDPPSLDQVASCCSRIGGKLVEPGEVESASSLGSQRFSFSFLDRHWLSRWNGQTTVSAASSSSVGSA